MRDPKRIKPFCDSLASIWQIVPDWRLSQLMINAITDYINEHKIEPFHMEDEEFINYLLNYVNKITNANNEST